MQDITDTLRSIDRRLALTDEVRQKRAKAGRKGVTAVSRTEKGTFAKLTTTASQPKKTVKTPSKVVTEKKVEGARRLIATYCDAYKLRYGISPPITGQVAGQAKNLLGTIPLDRACEMVQAYLQMEDRWFLTKCHDFPTFAGNLGKVAVSLANGTAEPHEKRFWERVFGGQNGKGDVQQPVEAPGGSLGKQQLLGTGGNSPLESVCVSTGRSLRVRD